MYYFVNVMLDQIKIFHKKDRRQGDSMYNDIDQAILNFQRYLFFGSQI